MIVELLTFGNELLDGRRIDTNAAWIGKFLSGFGLQVRYHQTTQDRKEDIQSAFRLALERSDLIISTGGLGPTQDDITFEGLAEAINQPLVFHSDIFEEIKKKYDRRGIPCPISNRRQAMLPTGAIPINPIGTAPGCFLSVGHRKIFCFPGVPSEMQTMVESFLTEKIQTPPSFKPVFQKGYSLSGIAEALVEEQIQQNSLDHHALADIHVAYTASQSTVDVTFSVTPHKTNDKDQIINDIDVKFRAAFFGHLIRWDDRSIEEHIVEWFQNKKWTLGVAESITGGLIASKLVNVPGCSTILDRGVVTYSYQSKKDILGVSEATLNRYGAVSAECVLEMARGLRKKSNVDVAIAICGIAGPGGATETKPLGLTYIGWVGPTFELEKAKSKGIINYVKSIDFEKKIRPEIQSSVINRNEQVKSEWVCNDENGFAKVQGFVFSGDRERNRMQAANQALMGLYSFITCFSDVVTSHE